MYVLVTGLPGSGKTTLAPRLAEALDLPLLSKDTIKEALWDALGAGDRAWSTHLGRASVLALLSLARSANGVVIDHFVHADTAHEWQLPGLVEVRCACPAEVARRRYATRRRHPCHFDAEQLADAFDRWVADDASRAPLGPRLDVDTTGMVDVAAIVAWARGARASS